MPLPKIGDKHTQMCYLYQDIKMGYTVVSAHKCTTPGPKYAYLSETEVTFTILTDGTSEVVKALEEAKAEALKQYTERVTAINEQLSKYLAIEGH